MASTKADASKISLPDFTANAEFWPVLPPLEAWQDTRDTVHMWTQIVGKVRLALNPLINHWWEVPLYVSPRGLATSSIPYARGIFEVEFDFLADHVLIQTSEGAGKSLSLRPRSVADFYKEFMAALASLGITVKIWTLPAEVPNPIAFDRDLQHASYDRDAVIRFWRALVAVDTVFQEFRSRFIGKNSPVHFFWGSFDLAVTRFSGRRAPERPGADRVTREAYSHEVISAGFWPGSGAVQETAFYAYAAPEPPGLRDLAPQPSAAYYQPQMGIFILPYAAVRAAASPVDALLAFLHGTYDAAANLAGWDRPALEQPAVTSQADR